MLKNWGDEAVDDEGGDGAPQTKKQTQKFNSIELVDGELPENKSWIKDGIKTVIEYTRRPDGKVVMKTRTYKLENREVVVTKGVMERRNWAKFGVSKNLAPGPDPASTNVVIDDIFLVLSSKKEVKDDSDEQDKLADKLKGRMVSCRICKGDHWTTKCPYKDKMAVARPDGAEPLDGEGADKPKGDGGEASGAGESEGPGVNSKGVYVPPSQRAGRRGEGQSMDKRDDTATIRITNLSENTREDDLRELFRPFGPISRCYLATDRETGQARGFAFINYLNKSDAQTAIDNLNGHGYDHLILQVEWAPERKEKEY